MVCGAAAAMGMIFGNPLITVILLLEAAVVKGAQGGKAALMALLPVMFALGFGYAVQVGFDNVPGVGSNTLAVPGLPAYPALSAGDLLASVPTALVAGLVAALAIEAGRRVRVLSSPRPLAAIVVAGLVVAALALAVQYSTTLSVDAVLFSGQSAIPTVLTVTSVGTLLLVGIAKAVAYSVSLGGGFRGGMIFPAVYLGVVVGTIASLVAALGGAGPDGRRRDRRRLGGRRAPAGHRAPCSRCCSAPSPGWRSRPPRSSARASGCSSASPRTPGWPRAWPTPPAAEAAAVAS